MQLKTYTHYKNSGIAWLGDIPAHWEVKKLKYLSNVVLGKMLCNEDKGEYYKKPYLKSKNIQWLRVDISDVEEMWFSKREMQTYQLKNGDLVLSEGGEVGKTCIWRDELEECFIQNSAHKVTIHPIGIPEYYLYLFYLYGYKGGFESIVNKVSIAHLTRDKLVNLKCLMPPFAEQTAIAQFLDYKTEQIDRFIHQKKQLIALLKEQKAVIINDAVTKGLNPSVLMQSSGIEWLGEVPAHWEIKKLKYLSDIVLGKMLCNEDKGGYYKKPYLKSKNIQWLRVDISDVEEMWFSEKEMQIYRLKKGDLVLSEGGEVGKTCLWNAELEECFIQNSAHKVSIYPTGMPEYYLYLFYSYGYQGFFESIVNKVSIGHLTRDKLVNLKCIVPPLAEQTAIVMHIETATAQLNEAIGTIEKEIALVQEYRIALISEAVTGKIFVQDKKISTPLFSFHEIENL